MQISLLSVFSAIRLNFDLSVIDCKANKIGRGLPGLKETGRFNFDYFFYFFILCVSIVIDCGCVLLFSCAILYIILKAYFGGRIITDFASSPP